MFFQVQSNSDVSPDPTLSFFSTMSQQDYTGDMTPLAIKNYILSHQWPDVVAIDFTRFSSIKQNVHASDGQCSSNLFSFLFQLTALSLWPLTLQIPN